MAQLAEATSRKVVCSVTDGVIKGFFLLIYPSDRTMALGVYRVSSINEYQDYILGVNAAGA